MLADNKIALNAGWNMDLLAEELANISTMALSFDLGVIGFEMAEIDLIIDGAGDPLGPDRTPETAPEPDPAADIVCRRGDLWHLGNHRILCGDAKSPADLATLMGKDRADGVFTDPPYNVPIRGHVTGKGRVGGNVPLGYEPDGRTLKIGEEDAKTIRTIYDLYIRHKNVRKTKEEVDRLGLRTAIRMQSSGKEKGGTLFSFGHIYHILTNPIYAGRIRHKEKVYEGQHPPIIAPAVWDNLQNLMQTGSVKTRSGAGRKVNGKKKSVSRLTGKIFDQTGDRLTPSHSKTAKGRRLRYYVSHRLIRSTGSKDPSGWRLLGPELEALVADIVAKHLRDPAVRANIVPDAAADELAAIDQRLSGLLAIDKGRADEIQTTLLATVERVDIAPGEIRNALSPVQIATLLQVEPERVSGDILGISSAFGHRKRGVETRLILENHAVSRDEILFKNIARAHRYFDMILSGRTFGEIADAEGASKRRVQQLIELAFLAPDIVRDAFEGGQPTGLTSEWLACHAIPPVWQDQRELFKAL